jgi:hypothetical protein
MGTTCFFNKGRLHSDKVLGNEIIVPRQPDFDTVRNGDGIPLGIIKMGGDFTG